MKSKSPAMCVEIWAHDNSFVYIVSYRDGTAILRFFYLPRTSYDRNVAAIIPEWGFEAVSLKIRPYKYLRNARRFAKKHLF